MTRLHVRAFVLLFVLVLVQTTAVLARPTVIVGGVVVMRFTGDGRMSADQRARVVQRNVDAAIRMRRPASAIQAVERKGLYVIVWGGRAICTVDEVQAEDNDCSVKELAFQWVRNLRDAAKVGFLAVTPDALVMGVGTSRALKVTGLASGRIRAAARGRGLTVSVRGDTLTVKASAIGRGSVRVVRDGAAVVVAVAVKESAGSVPARIVQSVTGAPANKDILDEAIELAARTNISARPGAAVEWRLVSPAPAVLAPGTESTVKMDVSISGPDFFTVSRVVDVTLRNENVSMPPPALLMVSNRPEKIGGEGVLFRGGFRRDQPTRLLYSHVNAAGQPQYLWVNLSNPSSEAIRLQVVQSDGGPAPEELYVGHRCNTRFLEELARNQGVVITIPAGRTLCLGQYRLSAKEIVSGLAQMQLLSGNEVVVSVETSANRDRVGQIDRLVEAPFNPFRIHPKGVFASPNIVVSSTYVAGSTEPCEIPFGKSPWLIDPVSGEPNTGNYGVLYEVRLELQNPTSRNQKVSILFEPVKGVALGSFWVEGRLLETSCLKPPSRERFETVELLPGQSRTIRIVTMPQAGSHYPARIVIESPVQETTRGTDSL